MFIRHNVLWVLWTLIIIGLCVTPGKELPSFEWYDFISLDKLAHVFVYGMLVVLMLTGFNKQFTYSFIKEKSFYIVVTYATLLGVALELIQHFLIADRTFEWADIIANSVGVVLGSFLFFLIYRKCLVRS